MNNMSGSSLFVVDFVARGVEPDEWRLVLVEQGPWHGDTDTELSRLQTRLYDCIDAALDGQLAAKYPESRGKRVVIQVDGYELPAEEVSTFFMRFSSELPKLDGYTDAVTGNAYVASIGFELNLAPTLTLPKSPAARRSK
jgi:hypothetical protein